jgi:hypothetical protein
VSEEGTAVAAPTEAAPAPPPVVEEVAAPVSSPEPPPVAPAQESPPLPPRSVRQQAKERMLQRVEAAETARRDSLTPGKVDDQGRVHATEDGTYMDKGAAPAAPEEGAAPAAPAEPEGTAAVVAEPVSDETPPAAPAAAPGLVTIALDPTGPLADQGVSELSVPADMERHVRTLVNAAVRQRDVQDSKSALEQAHLDNSRLAARVQALTEGTPEVDPIQADMLAQIKQHYPEQLAEVEAALDAKRQNATAAKEAEIYEQFQREHVAKSFIGDVSGTSAQKYPAWAAAGELQGRMQSAMAQYGDYVDARNLNLQRQGQPLSQPTTEEFYGWVDTTYIKDPRVQDQVKKYRSEQQEKGRAEIAAQERLKLAEKEKATLAEAAERHSTRPPSTPGIPSQGTTPPGPEATDPAKQHGSRAKALKAQIRDRYRPQA